MAPILSVASPSPRVAFERGVVRPWFDLSRRLRILWMIFVGIFELIVGLGICGFWTFALATHQVPEIAAGDRAIRFHIAAESLTGLALATAGLLLLAVDDRSWIRALAAAALGGMIYSTINSPGYYAQRKQGGVVVAFIGLTVVGVAALLTLILA